MRYLLVVIALSSAARLHGQKIDSLLIRLPVSRDQAEGAVVAAFTRAGLGITNTTPFLVEADQGATQNQFLGGDYHRVVRAILTSPDSVHTLVLIVGDETRKDESGNTTQRLRIDNRAGGKGGKVWKMMVAAAMALDSTAVPTAAVSH